MSCGRRCRCPPAVHDGDRNGRCSRRRPPWTLSLPLVPPLCPSRGRPAGRSHLSRPTGARQRRRETAGADVSVAVAAANDDRAPRGDRRGTRWRSTVGLVSTTRPGFPGRLAVTIARPSGLSATSGLVLVSHYLGVGHRRYADGAIEQHWRTSEEIPG